MSRSKRKTPIMKVDGFGKYGKRQANKRVRKCHNVSGGRWYIKLYDQYNIRDLRINLWDWFTDKTWKRWIK